MILDLELKHRIHKEALALVLEKLDDLSDRIKQLQSESNNETKSSAGDKYETARAMLQLEKDKAGHQLSEITKLKSVLQQLSRIEENDTIGLGSIFRLQSGIFYLSVSLGKIKTDDMEYYCISAVSPLGKMLLGKKVGDSVSLNNKKFSVLELI